MRRRVLRSCEKSCRRLIWIENGKYRMFWEGGVVDWGRTDRQVGVKSEEEREVYGVVWGRL